MPGVTPAPARSGVVVEIGGVPIRLCADDSGFLNMLQSRYTGFVAPSAPARFEFEINLTSPGSASVDEDVSVKWDSGRWFMERGDFRAEWNPKTARGKIRQAAYPYALDSVLRIVHSLLLAEDGSFLLHASSAVRNGRAFLFTGVSGAGKTTMMRLAPPDATLLTDEISYVKRHGEEFEAFGTPFAGELGRPGENLRAPIAAVYLLAKGQKNKLEPLRPGDAARALLANILFFAQDQALVRAVFEAACQFASRVPVQRLTFVPDARVWELIG